MGATRPLLAEGIGGKLWQRDHSGWWKRGDTGGHPGALWEWSERRRLPCGVLCGFRGLRVRISGTLGPSQPEARRPGGAACGRPGPGVRTAWVAQGSEDGARHGLAAQIRLLGGLPGAWLAEVGAARRGCEQGKWRGMEVEDRQVWPGPPGGWEWGAGVQRAALGSLRVHVPPPRASVQLLGAGAPRGRKGCRARPSAGLWG